MIPSSSPSSPSSSSSSPSSIPNPPNPSTKLTIMDLNDQWITNPGTPKFLLQCPICFNIAVEPIECANCERLFCRSDFQESKIVKNCCPLCKVTPWKIKEQPHILYRQMFEQPIFECQLCNSKGTSLSLPTLKSHLLNTHNTIIRSHSRPLKPYKLVLSAYQEKALQFYQNLEINYRSCSGVNTFKLMDRELGELRVDFVNMSVKYREGSNYLKTAQLKQIPTIPKNNPNLQAKDYNVWQFDSNKGVYQFMLDEQQEKVQEGYQIFLAEPLFNQIILDLKDKGIRYYVDFKTMQQRNVKSGFVRSIRRITTIKFTQP